MREGREEWWGGLTAQRKAAKAGRGRRRAPPGLREWTLTLEGNAALKGKSTSKEELPLWPGFTHAFALRSRWQRRTINRSGTLSPHALPSCPPTPASPASQAALGMTN